MCAWEVESAPAGSCKQAASHPWVPILLSHTVWYQTQPMCVWKLRSIYWIRLVLSLTLNDICKSAKLYIQIKISLYDAGTGICTTGGYNSCAYHCSIMPVLFVSNYKIRLRFGNITLKVQMPDRSFISLVTLFVEFRLLALWLQD